jgi:hypothetical protein
MQDQGQKRPKPYIWASWLTKLLAGEDSCWWKSWYRAHYKYTKTPDDADRADFFREWTRKHDAIVQRRATELRGQGYVVRVEEDASFKLHGGAADVAGKPDLVALKDSAALVVDAKSGRRRSSDHWQVLLYLFALPVSWLSAPEIKLRGEVAYADADEPVRALKVPERDAILNAIRRVSAPTPPPQVPSAHECARCDVAACAKRHAVPTGDASKWF